MCLLRAVLVDDERCVLEELAYQLDGKVNICGKFTNSLEAVEAIPALAPDVVFLDIEMPGLNGLETASEILTLLPKTAIIFVTAYSHHAVNAFDLNAVDYLIKPVQPQRLAKALDRLSRRLIENLQTAEGDKLKSLLQSLLLTNRPDTILLWKDKHLEVKAAETIAGCFVTKGMRSVRVVIGGQIYQASGSLTDFVAKLRDGLLVRCHRSYYINPLCLVRLDRTTDNSLAYLAGYSDPIPVSRAYRHSLLKSLNI